MSIFRPEVEEFRRTKLYGEVFLVQPLSYTIMALLLVSLVAFFIFYIAMGSFAQTEEVVGKIVPSKGILRMQSPSIGHIENLYVIEGDYVESGTALFSVLSAKMLNDGQTVEELGLQSIREQQDNIKKETNFEGNLLSGRIEQIEAELKSKSLEQQSLKTRLGLQLQITESAKHALDSAQKLVGQGYISNLEVSRREENWLASKQQASFIKQQAELAESEIVQLRIRLKQIPIEYDQRRERLVSQLSELERQESELEGQRALTVRAPVAGKVTGLLVNVGQSVQPGQNLLSILPAESSLYAELYVPSKSIGFVRKGQKVLLKYEAFPYQRFGSFKAEIEVITLTILSVSDIAASHLISEPVYRVRAVLEQETININSNPIPLQEGMQFTANIILEERIILDWLLAPLRSLGNTR